MQKPIIAIISDLEENQEERFIINTKYTKAIEEEKGIPLILPYNQDFKFVLKKVQGIMLIGGGIYFKNKNKYKNLKLEKTNPKRYKFEKDVIQYAIKKRKPLLGICRGAQMIAEVLGGTVITAPKKIILKHEKNKHNILIKIDSLLHKKMNKEKIEVNSFHKKIITQIPKQLLTSSVSEKDNVIESFESKDGLIIGFQFHPERLKKYTRKQFFNIFIQQTKKTKNIF